jgi:hypothetical protein
VANWLSIRGAAPFEIKDGVDVTIGRGQHCDLCLYSTMLSREHARVRWENGRPVLFDLESLNGTFVGLDRVARHQLRDGDLIRLGDITVQFRVCQGPPAEPPDETAAPDALAPDEETAVAPDAFETSNETRIYSRTAVLHQKVFEYDELAWLMGELGTRAAALLGPSSIEQPDLGAWFGEVGHDEAAVWELLRLGVIRPRDAKTPLRALPGRVVAAACVMTKRAEKLRGALAGQKAIWNEMAALRYQVRQGPIFKPLRLVARAYRPGRGLDEVTLERLIYELENIYAPDLAGPVLDAELRRLQVLGFLCPSPGRRAEAWFPVSWNDGTIQLAPRGRAMLEGFRLEE